MAENELAPYYVDTRRPLPSAAAEFWAGYMSMRAPLVLERERARLAAADPTARLKLLGDLQAQKARILESWGQLVRAREENVLKGDELAVRMVEAEKAVEVARTTGEYGVSQAEVAGEYGLRTARTKAKGDLDAARINAYTAASNNRQVTPAGRDALEQIKLAMDGVVANLQKAEKLNAGGPPTDEQIKVARNLLLVQLDQQMPAFQGMRPEEQRQFANELMLQVAQAPGTEEQKGLIRSVVASQFKDLQATLEMPDVGVLQEGGVRGRTVAPTPGATRGQTVVDMLTPVRNSGLVSQGGSTTSTTTERRASGSTTTPSPSAPSQYAPTPRSSTTAPSTTPSSPAPSQSTSANPTPSPPADPATSTGSDGGGAYDSVFGQALRDIDAQIAEQTKAAQRGALELGGGLYATTPGTAQAARPRRAPSSIRPDREGGGFAKRAVEKLLGPKKTEQPPMELPAMPKPGAEPVEDEPRRKKKRGKGSEQDDDLAFQPPTYSGSQLG